MLQYAKDEKALWRVMKLLERNQEKKNIKLVLVKFKSLNAAKTCGE